MYITGNSKINCSDSMISHFFPAKNTSSSTTRKMNFLTVLLFLSATIQLSLGQEESHPSSDANIEVSSKQRTVYQKQLSPHRMMHFGKRPLVMLPPTITVPIRAGYNDQAPYRVPPQFRREDPYMFSFDTLQGQQWQELPTARDVDLGSDQNIGSQNSLLGYERFGDGERSNNALNQQQQAALARAQVSQRLMKLIASNLDEDSNESGAADEQQQTNGPISSQRGNSQSSGDSSAINVSSRSVPMTRSTAYSSPKTYISRLMFGQPMEIQQSVLSPVQPSFNKKAEPKKQSN